MSRLLFACILALLTIVPARSYAAGVIANAKVTEVRIDSNGWGMVFFDVLVAGTPPSCVHPAYKNALAFDANTAGGKAIMAVALSAKAAGSIVHVYGLGTCNIFGGHVEDWSYGVSK